MSSCHNEIARYIYTWMGIWIMKGYVQDSLGMMLVGKGRQTHWRNNFIRIQNSKLHVLVKYALFCFSVSRETLILDKCNKYIIINQPTRDLYRGLGPIRRCDSQAGVGRHNGWSLNYPCLVGISFCSESFSRNLGLHYARRKDVQQFRALGDSNIRILKHDIITLLFLEAIIQAGLMSLLK